MYFCYVSDFINCSYRCKGHTISFSLCNINSLSLAFIVHLWKTRKCVYTWCCTHHTRPEKVATTHDLYSLNGKTSYREISRSLEATRLDLILTISLWNLIGISAAQISEQLEKAKPESRGFKILRKDVRPLYEYNHIWFFHVWAGYHAIIYSFPSPVKSHHIPRPKKIAD